MKMIHCTEDDLDRLEVFYDQVTAHLEATTNWPLWEHRVYPCRESVAAAIAAGTQYACEVDGVIAGALILNDDPQGNYEIGHWSRPLLPGSYLVIHTLAVSPDFSGQGIGVAMVDFCIQYAKEHGMKGIRLDAVPGNIPARKLYEKCGFQFAGEVDLKREDCSIPTFALYEYHLSDC